LQRWICPELPVIVEVFVSQCDRRDALGEHALLVMNGEDRIPRVWDDGVERFEELANAKIEARYNLGAPCHHDVSHQRE
jgi:hypothetical protein